MATAAMKKRQTGCQIRVNNMGAEVRVEVEEKVVKTRLAVEKAVVVDGVALHRTRNQHLLKENQQQQLREADLGRIEGIHHSVGLIGDPYFNQSEVNNSITPDDISAILRLFHHHFFSMI